MNRLWLVLLLAARDLGRQRRRALIAMAILVFGIVAVLMTRGWQRGMLEQIAREGAGVWLGAVAVKPAGTLAARDAFSLTPSVALDDVRLLNTAGVPEVTATTPRIRFLARLFHGDEQSAPCFVLASDFRSAPAVQPRLFSPDRLEAGRLPTAADEVMVAAPLADILRLKVGDRATLLARPADGGLEGIDVVVVGLVRAAFEENQRRAVIMDLGAAQRMLRMEGRATELLYGVEPLDRADAVAAALNATLSPGLEAHSWEQINPRYIAARKIWATSLAVMFAVVIAVACMGISTSLHLMVRERVRDVATMAALGVPRAALFAMFLAQGALLGGTGGALGAALGGALVTFLGARGVSFLPPGGFMLKVEPQLSSGDILATVVVAALLSSLVMAVPAWRAARRPPAEILR